LLTCCNHTLIIFLHLGAQTIANPDYQFYATPGNTDSLLVRVKTAQDVYLTLRSRAEQDASPPYCDIRLGKNKNKRSTISCERNNQNEGIKQGTDMVRTYLIGIKKNLIFRNFSF
jgi:hypothetical protein